MLHFHCNFAPASWRRGTAAAAVVFVSIGERGHVDLRDGAGREWHHVKRVEDFVQGTPKLRLNGFDLVDGREQRRQ